jgi:hypothetical protein
MKPWPDKAARAAAGWKPRVIELAIRQSLNSVWLRGLPSACAFFAARFEGFQYTIWQSRNLK